MYDNARLAGSHWPLFEGAKTRLPVKSAQKLQIV